MGSLDNGHLAERRFGTLAVHAGAPHDTTGAVIAPVGFYTLGSIEQWYSCPAYRFPCLQPMLKPVSVTPSDPTNTLGARTPIGQLRAQNCW